MKKGDGLFIKTCFEISKKYPNQLSLIDHEQRFLPSFQKLKEYIENGSIGNIIQMEVSWKRYWEPNRTYDWWSEESNGGGILFAIGSHYIDMLTWLTNKQVKSVYGNLKTFTKQRKDLEGKIHDVTADDYCSMNLDYEGDIPCSITMNSNVSTSNTGYHTIISIHGDKGSIQWNQGDLTVYSNQEKIFEYKEIYEKNLTNAFTLGTYYLGLALKDHFEGKSDISKICASFKSAIHVQKVMDGCKLSNLQKKLIKI